MTVRLAIAILVAGLLLLSAGVFLSEGYSARRGFLESLPQMKVRLTADEKRARFGQVPLSYPAAGPLIDFEGAMIQMPRPMEDFEVRNVLEAYGAQRLAPAKPENKYLFEGWTIDTQGTTLPLGPVLALAAALIVIGAALLFGARRTKSASANG